MSNLAAVLKDEIRRLARKEARVQVSVLRSASTQYRRAIAALRRANKELMGKFARLDAVLTKRATAVPAVEDAYTVRFAPAWVRGHRSNIGLSQEAYGRLVGVSSMTIYNWEKGLSRPRGKQLAAWGAVKKIGTREAAQRLDALKGKARKAPPPRSGSAKRQKRRG